MILTKREEQIISLVATGMKDGAIAHCVGISPRTVHAHLRRIFTKTNSKNRSEAAFWYLKAKKLIKEEDEKFFL